MRDAIEIGTVRDTGYLTFAGLDAPIALQDGAGLLAQIEAVAPAWPVAVSEIPGPVPPFAHVAPDGPGRWRLSFRDNPDAAQTWDTVDSICDIVAELAWEKLRSRPDLLCLHAAAVEFEERLVLFPNARRAGKSTLSIALARLGRRLFTDDYLPVELDRRDGALRGLANGILPRLRLPVPATFSPAFHDWVARDPAPGNDRYKYLADLTLAPGGATLPLGAIVLLERDETAAAPPSLASVTRDEVLSGVIGQNFARSLHAGLILRSLDALTRALPLFKLTYSNAEDAAAFLDVHPALKDLPAARMEGALPEHAMAPLDRLSEAPPAYDPARAYVQATGLTAAEADGAHFLADAAGLGIHRLNQGTAAIWRLLEEPMTRDEVIDILCVAFPDVAPERIAADSDAALADLARARLIVPSDDGAAALDRGAA